MATEFVGSGTSVASGLNIVRTGMVNGGPGSQGGDSDCEDLHQLVIISCRNAVL